MLAAPEPTADSRAGRAAAQLRVWDPVLTAETVQALFPGVDTCRRHRSRYRRDRHHRADRVPEVTGLDWRTVAQAAAPGCLVIDAKNVLDQTSVISAGLTYRGVGRVPANMKEP